MWSSDQRRHAAYANSLPLRRVLVRRTAYSQEVPQVVTRIEEELECGHIISASDIANRRRCWQCGPRQEGVA